jgi:hypothetical protein
MTDHGFLRDLASRLQTGELNGELTSDEEVARLRYIADEVEEIDCSGPEYYQRSKWWSEL